LAPTAELSQPRRTSNADLGKTVAEQIHCPERCFAGKEPDSRNNGYVAVQFDEARLIAIVRALGYRARPELVCRSLAAGTNL
jgi:hypothetical protein